MDVCKPRDIVKWLKRPASTAVDSGSNPITVLINSLYGCLVASHTERRGLVMREPLKMWSGPNQTVVNQRSLEFALEVERQSIFHFSLESFLTVKSGEKSWNEHCFSSISK